MVMMRLKGGQSDALVSSAESQCWVTQAVNAKRWLEKSSYDNDERGPYA